MFFKIEISKNYYKDYRRSKHLKRSGQYVEWHYVKKGISYFFKIVHLNDK
jgi:hypothetical protein